MSGTNTAGVRPATRQPVVERGDTIQAGQLRAAISTAAVGLVSAGIHDGKMNVSPSQALEAAAAIYLMVHTASNMRTMMSHVAKKYCDDNAYDYLVAQAREETSSR